MRYAVATFAAVLAALLAAPAQATFVVREQINGVNAYRLGDDGDTNSLSVQYVSGDPDSREYHFIDSSDPDGVSISTGAAASCTQSGPSVVRCNDNVSLVRIELSAGNDRLEVDHAVGADDGVPDIISVDAGAGNDDIEGSDLAGDTLVGGTGDDKIFGFGGGDTIQGGDGNDTLRGSNDPAEPFDISDNPDAADAIDGQNGNDQTFGDDGNDTLTETGTGNDTITGGIGDDEINDANGTTNTIAGGDGRDTMVTGGANDNVDGGPNATGTEVISDSGGTANTLRGGTGVDRITSSGASANDTIEGGDGADSISAGPGNDTVFGATQASPNAAGDGADGITPGVGRDAVNAGTSAGDAVSYADAARTVGVTVTLNAGAGNEGSTADEVGGVRDTLTEVEHVTGSAHDDDITGDADVNSLAGGSAGADVLRGLLGSDTLTGGTGDDTMDGGDGSDTMNGGEGTDAVDYSARSAGVTVTLNSAGAADDDGRIPDDGATASTLDDVDDTEIAIGGSAADTLVADSARASTLVGGGGDDTLTGGSGADTLDGGGGSDVMDGRDGTDVLTYASRSEALTVTLNNGASDDGGVADTSGASRDSTAAIENVIGGEAADSLTGDGGSNRLDGGPGDDTLQGLLGDDQIVGGDGSDLATYAERGAGDPVSIILDGAANDGGPGETDLVDASVEGVEGGAGPDVLTGGSGDDRLIGGDGGDRLTGLSGIDAFVAGAGDDTLEAKDGVAESVDCGAGTDGGNADAEDTLTACEAINPPVVVVDNDRDGVPFGLDCDDNDARRVPGGTEIPGNAVDEDCKDGPAAFSLITATASVFFRTRGARTRFTRVTVSDLPAGTRILLTCKAPRRKRRACPFRRFDRTFTTATRRVNLLPRFKKRRFVPKVTVTLSVTHPLAIGRVRRIRTRRNKAPKVASLCLTPGETRAKACR